MPGQRKPAGVDRFEPYAEYCRIRFADDPHLWATTLFEEVRELKYDGAYPSFTRALRKRGLRPRCERCAAAGTPAERYGPRPRTCPFRGLQGDCAVRHAVAVA